MTSENTITGRVTEVTTGYSAFTWTIHDFHLCSGSCCTGKSFTSPEFITKIISNTGQQNGENIWKLKLYRTYTEDTFPCTYYFTICIYGQSIGRKTYVSLSILDSENNKVSGIKKPVSNHELTGSETKFLHYHLLADIGARNYKILPKGHLTLLCELSTDGIRTIKIDSGLESLSNDLGIILQNKNTSDVVIVVGDEKFYAHKAILMSRSLVFRARFENAMKEKRQNTVHIFNFDSKVIQEMLHFIYTGEVKNINGLESGLLRAAEQYELESLKIKCANILSENLKVENACEMLALANHYKLTQFKNDVLKFIVSNAEKMYDS